MDLKYYDQLKNVRNETRELGHTGIEKSITDIKRQRVKDQMRDIETTYELPSSQNWTDWSSSASNALSALNLWS